jgi:hypothetical protein
MAREKQRQAWPKARRSEPFYVFGAAGATSDNRKTEPLGALQALSLRDSPKLANSLQKREKSRGKSFFAY